MFCFVPSTQQNHQSCQIAMKKDIILLIVFGVVLIHNGIKWVSWLWANKRVRRHTIVFHEYKSWFCEPTKEWEGRAQSTSRSVSAPERTKLNWCHHEFNLWSIYTLQPPGILLFALYFYCHEAKSLTKVLLKLLLFTLQKPKARGSRLPGRLGSWQAAAAEGTPVVAPDMRSHNTNNGGTVSCRDLCSGAGF